MTTQLHIVGAGGHAKVVIETARAAGYEVVACYDDGEAQWGTVPLGVPCVGPIAELAARAERGACRTVLAIGNNRVREALARELGCEFVAIVHPSAVVAESARLDPGAVVFAGAVIQPDTAVGAHAIVNTGASIDHDCAIGAFCHLAPGVRVAGGVTLGEGVFMGIGSAITPGRSVGAWTTVGAGATVVRDLPGGITAVGTPAKRLR